MGWSLGRPGEVTRITYANRLKECNLFILKLNMSNFFILNLSGMVGRQIINSIMYITDLTLLIISVIRGWFESPGSFSRVGRQTTISQIIFTGIDALPTITFLSIAIGIGVTTQFILLLQDLITHREIINILTRVIAFELGSLLTSIIIIGRSGSAITIDLGNMSLNREIEGLDLLGIDVKQFFILPRLLGVTFSQLALAFYFSLFAMVAGITFSAVLDSALNFRYLFDLPQAFGVEQLVMFLFKNILFGIIIGTTSCYHGLRVAVSVTEIPQETQRSIVNSLIIIFILDGIIALLLL
jgi:phospholipid/cholesterol/gamma-HCH transport system permease protein